jgi:hypothetical protein
LFYSFIILLLFFFLSSSFLLWLNDLFSCVFSFFANYFWLVFMDFCFVVIFEAYRKHLFFLVGLGFELRALCLQSFRVSVSFALLWQNTWHQQLQGGKVYFGSRFQSFYSMSVSVIALGLRWGGTLGWAGDYAAECLPHGSWEGVGEAETRARDKINPSRAWPQRPTSSK